MMSVFDDKDFEYGSTPESLELAKRFANRTTKQIATGDAQAFGNLSSADALSALENGTYRGLEGIDFGTAYGSPVARLPNGMVVDVTAGTMLSAIKTREAKRREIVAKMLRANDRDAYREKNRGSFDALLSGLVEEGGLSEAAAQLYRNEFDGNNPASVLTTLLGFDRTDMRAIKAAEETARAARDQTHSQGVDRRFAILTQDNQDMAGQGLPPTEQGNLSTQYGAFEYLHTVANKSADWEQTTDSGEVAQFFGARIVATDPKLAEAFSALRKRISENPDLSAVDLAESPQFASLVKGVSTSAAKLAPMSPEYATQVVADMIGAGNVFIEAAEATVSQRTSKAAGDRINLGLNQFRPSGQDLNSDGEVTDAERQAYATRALDFVRFQLQGMGVTNASDLSDSEVRSMIVELGLQGNDLARRTMQIVSNRFGLPLYDRVLQQIQGGTEAGAAGFDPTAGSGMSTSSAPYPISNQTLNLPLNVGVPGGYSGRRTFTPLYNFDTPPAQGTVGEQGNFDPLSIENAQKFRFDVDRRQLVPVDD